MVRTLEDGLKLNETIKGIQFLDELCDLSFSEVTISVDIERRRVTKSGLQI